MLLEKRWIQLTVWSSKRNWQHRQRLSMCCTCSLSAWLRGTLRTRIGSRLYWYCIFTASLVEISTYGIYTTDSLMRQLPMHSTVIYIPLMISCISIVSCKRTVMLLLQVIPCIVASVAAQRLKPREPVLCSVVDKSCLLSSPPCNIPTSGIITARGPIWPRALLHSSSTARYKIPSVHQWRRLPHLRKTVFSDIGCGQVVWFGNLADQHFTFLYALTACLRRGLGGLDRGRTESQTSQTM